MNLLLLQLTKIGFKIIDALDPSSGMLEKAREKGLYRKYICEAIGTEPLDIPSGNKKVLIIFFYQLWYLVFFFYSIKSKIVRQVQQLLKMRCKSFKMNNYKINRDTQIETRRLGGQRTIKSNLYNFRHDFFSPKPLFSKEKSPIFKILNLNIFSIFIQSSFCKEDWYNLHMATTIEPS